MAGMRNPDIVKRDCRDAMGEGCCVRRRFIKNLDTITLRKLQSLDSIECGLRTLRGSPMNDGKETHTNSSALGTEKTRMSGWKTIELSGLDAYR